MVVRPQPGGRGDRLARRRRRRGGRSRGDELLPHGARRRRDAARHPRERRHRPALPGPGRLLDARAGERAGGLRRGLAADRDVPERRVLPDLRHPARLDRPAAAPALGQAAAGRQRSPGTCSAGRAEHGGLRASDDVRDHGARPGGAARSIASARTSTLSGRARAPGTATTSSATPSTSTGATSTRRGTTGVSRRTGTGS